jgi:hypothetical protein
MDAAVRRGARKAFAVAAQLVLPLCLSACATAPDERGTADSAPEVIYILRSIREPSTADAGACPAAKIGFAPFATDAERFFSFWSVRTRSDDGRMVDAKAGRVAQLRGCFGATPERARQNFYAEVEIGDISFRGSGECLALMVDFPEPGLYPVRCQLVLKDLPAPFVGGVLTTNTITSGASFGGETTPPGYTQASIATIRLWKTKSQ